jgi:branched-subunit amino acid transport protein AzlD
MPVLIWAVLRLVRAIGETVALLTNLKVMRALPWHYIRALPRENKLIGFTTASLTLSVLGLLVGLVAPGVRPVAALVAAVSLAVSWVVGHRKPRRAR